MLLGGDEIGRTQGGNNNAWCQDNEISWFDWDARRRPAVAARVHQAADRAAPRAPGLPAPPVPARHRASRARGCPTCGGSALDGRRMTRDDWQDGAADGARDVPQRRGDRHAGTARASASSTTRSCCCSTPTTRTSRSRCRNRRFGAALGARALDDRPGRSSRARSRSRPGAGGARRRARWCCCGAPPDGGLPRHLPAPARAGAAASRDARALVPYLRDLGVSPPVPVAVVPGAREGSTHGYDVVDPRRISEALGGEEELPRAGRGGARGRAWGSCSTSSPTTWRPTTPTASGPTRRCARSSSTSTRRPGRHRRFFDIDHLAGVRQEDPEVFADDARAGAARSSATGVVDGLRIDHPDGLADPARYLRAAARRRAPTHVWVEKILDPGERAARLAGRGHGRLRVPQRRGGAVRRPGRRGAADRAVAGRLRRRRGRSSRSRSRPSSSRRATTFAPEVERAAARRTIAGDLPSARSRRCRSTAPTSTGSGRAPERPRGVAARGRALERVLLARAPPRRVRHALPADARRR